MLSRVLVTIVLLPLTVGCVRVSATRIAPVGPAVSADSVRVFATQSPGDYTELAILRVHRFLVTDQHVLGALRRRAARLGANGVLLLNTRGVAGGRSSGTGILIGGPHDGTVVAGTVESDVDELRRAVAIRYAPR